MFDEHVNDNIVYKVSLTTFISKKIFKPCIKILFSKIAQSNIKLGRQKIEKIIDFSNGLSYFTLIYTICSCV